MHWDTYLSEQDRLVMAKAGYGSRGRRGVRPALLVIDVTYAFCGDRPEPVLESIKRWRNSSGEAAWAAVAHVRELLDGARAAGAPVIYTRGLGATVPSGRWADKNTRAREDHDDHHEILREIAPRDGEPVLRKAKPSGFFGTPLASLLVDAGADSLIVCGGTTSGCVRATVVDGFSYNYPVAVAADACFDRVEASHWIGLFDMEMKYADVLPTADVLTHLRGEPGAPA
jgi:nicotinamidase-related amidase